MVSVIFFLVAPSAVCIEVRIEMGWGKSYRESTTSLYYGNLHVSQCGPRQSWDVDVPPHSYRKSVNTSKDTKGGNVYKSYERNVGGDGIEDV